MLFIAYVTCWRHALRAAGGYGFAADGRRFYFTLGSHEADEWVLDLNRQ
ncbi:MAG TPA: hypothetical protein VGA22_07960 [Gemmatimonadales bacterium]|jgi:hypothetical protein